MRHRVSGRKLNRTTSHLLAMLANMAVSLVQHEQIYTTLPKAKELRPFVEKLVTAAKKQSLHTRRYILSIIKDRLATEKLISVLGQRYQNRNGGYLRIIKAGFRYGDMSPMAYIEFVERNIEAKGKALEVRKVKVKVNEVADTNA